MGDGLNLYTYEFRLVEIAKLHKDAADELWLLKNKYNSLLVDFDYLPYESKISLRDKLIFEVDRINRIYPSTDEQGYEKAKEKYKEYCN